jgi:hypothetical protein
MNMLQWDLRYPYATEIAGFHAPIAAGGLEDSVQGPVVVPGTYSVVLDYGGKRTEQKFTVALDPRLHPTQADLEARLALDQQIHADLDALDKKINQALASRDKLQKAISGNISTNAQAASTLSALNRDIDNVAQMAIKSSEGELLHGTRLHDHLAYLAADIDLSFDRPTASHQAVFDQLHKQVKESMQKLEGDIAQAGGVAASAAAR